MKNVAPWLLALFFLFLFVFKTLECISLSETLTRINQANDNLQQADQRLQEATNNLMKACGK